MMNGEAAKDRMVLRIGGADRESFLHGLVTRDIKAADAGLVYSALLTPQGKYLADFFLLNRGDDILLDVKADIAQGLAQRLAMYRLRADVSIEDSELSVVRGHGVPPEGAWNDPRHEALGWRGYGMEGGAETTDWDAIRVAHCIPETGLELIPNETFILEAGFEALGGVDHRKGCYVGQEVTARMKHKTELRKGFVTVDIDGDAAFGAEIFAGERSVGTVFTRAGDKAIAYLRFDRAKGEMRAGEAKVNWSPPL